MSTPPWRDGSPKPTMPDMSGFARWLRSHLSPPRRTSDWLVWGVAIGLFAGLVAVTFFTALEWSSHQVSLATGLHAPAPAGEGLFHDSAAPGPLRLWLLALMPVVGGLLSGVLVYTLAPEAEGHGTDAMIRAFHHQGGVIHPRVPLIKGIATIFTLASGGSAGREGPIAQIGAGLGSWVGQKLRMPARDLRVMLLAGTAGGLGAIFRSPLGGAMTAIEVLYREDFEAEAFIPCVLSSVTAYAVFSSVFGHEPILGTQHFAAPGVAQLPFYAVLALLCLPVAALYCKVFYGAQDRLFRRLPLPRALRPAVGGALVGGMVLLCPQVFGPGWGYLQQAIGGELSVGLMAALVGLKILATTATISSGGSGGVFGPTLLIGGMVGGVVGHGAQALFPSTIPEPGAFVLVGMAALFASVAHAPLGALLMITEMTGGYALVPPLMLVSAIAILFSSRWSIYQNQLENRFHSPAHLGNMMAHVLRRITVREALPDRHTTVLPVGTTLGRIHALFLAQHQSTFPVVDGEQRFVGTIALGRIRELVPDPQLHHFMIAEDLLTDTVRCHPDENLFDVLRRMTEAGSTAIAVVDPADRRVLGLLGQEQILAAYAQRMTGAPGPAA